MLRGDLDTEAVFLQLFSDPKFGGLSGGFVDGIFSGLSSLLM